MRRVSTRNLRGFEGSRSASDLSVCLTRDRKQRPQARFPPKAAHPKQQPAKKPMQAAKPAEVPVQRKHHGKSDLVLEILRCHQRIEKILSSGPQHGLNLTTGTCTLRVDLKRFPKRVYTRSTRLCSGVNQHAHIGIQHRAESLEEPTMRVDLLLIVFLQTKHYLYRACVLSPRAELDHVILVELDPDLCSILWKSLSANISNIVQ